LEKKMSYPSNAKTVSVAENTMNLITVSEVGFDMD